MNTCRQLTIQTLICLFAAGFAPLNLFAKQSADDRRTANSRQTAKLVRDASNLLKKGRPLAALVAIEKAAIVETPTTLQDLALVRSIVGDCKGAMEAMDRNDALFQHVTEKVDLPENLRPLNAIEAIVQEAKDRQIVILNENHTTPMHRAFGQQLALRLYDEGFTYFAAEAFSLEMEQLKERKYPIRATGHYLQEPVFGNFVRTAMQKGYTPISYDHYFPFPIGDSTDQINARESVQCNQLMSQIFEKDPKAKVFIYVGGGHVSEHARHLPDGRTETWMAARLAKATGLDPLTIDQTEQRQRSRKELANSEWINAKKKGWFSKPDAQPIVLQKSDKTYLIGGGFHGRVDMQVFHPPVKLVEGRPDWLRRLGQRKPVPIPASIKLDPQKSNSRLLVQVFLANENANAIPIDQVVISSGSKRAVLLLPPGSHRVVVQDEFGKAVGQELSLEVND